MDDVIVRGLRESGYDLARHEAGHYIIARALGHDTGPVFIICDFGGGGNGGSECGIDRQLASTDDVVTYLEDRVLILFAGAMAENMVNGQVDEDRVIRSLEVQSKDDFSKIRENLRTIACIKRASDENLQVVLDRVKDDLWQRAQALVVQFDPYIDALAAELLSRIEGPGLKAEVADWDRPARGCARPSGFQTP